MKTYRAWFSTRSHTADRIVEARSPHDALRQAIAIATRRPKTLALVPVEFETSVHAICIMDDEGVVQCSWSNRDTRVQDAARDIVAIARDACGANPLAWCEAFFRLRCVIAWLDRQDRRCGRIERGQP